jgi:hypothetical protein
MVVWSTWRVLPKNLRWSCLIDQSMLFENKWVSPFPGELTKILISTKI